MHTFDDDHAPAETHIVAEKSDATHGSTGADGTELSPAIIQGDLRGDQRAALQFQRTAGNAAVVQLIGDEHDDDPHRLSRAVGGSGAPLDEVTRSTMESAFGTDFSDVRVHADGEAARSAKSLGAHAYTAGNQIVFGDGQYDPASTIGRKTLAHELTHVVQQRSGPVDGSDNGNGVKVSDPSDRFERAASETAEQVVANIEVQREHEEDERDD